MNQRQSIFVKQYLIDLNAKQAAIRAGYSEKTAESQASRLLRNVKVKQAIDKALGKVAAKLDITHEKICDELALIGFSDLGEFVEFGPTGVKIKKAQGKNTRCLAEVSETTSKEGGSIRFKLHSKVDALTELDDRLFGRPTQKLSHEGDLKLGVIVLPEIKEEVPYSGDGTSGS